MNFRIRLIQLKDNAAIANIIRSVLEEFCCSGPGWGSSDDEVNDMYNAYQDTNFSYFIVEDIETGKIYGGGGFAPLKGSDPAEKICELRKVYLLSQSRGHGLGKKLIQQIISSAADKGYHEIYLETAPQLSAAVELYLKLGFHNLDSNKGDTGHQAKCTIFMSLNLIGYIV